MLEEQGCEGGLQDGLFDSLQSPGECLALFELVSCPLQPEQTLSGTQRPVMALRTSIGRA